LPSQVHITGITGIPEIQPGDDLAGLIAAAVEAQGLRAGPGDIFVIAQKVVSKAEGRLVRLAEVKPSKLAREWGREHGKDARIIEVILNEARRIVRMERGILIVETRHGFICANAGVDSSNAPPGTVTLLPEDPDRSAELIRAKLEQRLQAPVATIISDTFGRPWREGFVNVALGVAGLAPLVSYRGQRDAFGRELQVTVMAAADELAGAAELVMGKNRQVPAALVQGFATARQEGVGRELLRPPERDLFR
jgi:coenzyme F420-0:L-glutamate ligase / coenzyme F420-1:gamma-L-glutamate ligase